MNHEMTGVHKGDILIVDDTPANLRLLTQILVEQGYHVRPVPEGSLALTAVRAEPPDLILLDIRMAGLNGYEVCEHLKADPQTRDIPILFISALDATHDKIKAFSVGGVDYVTKPFQVEEVLARVQTHLALRKLQKQLQDANRKMAQELALAGKVQSTFLPQGTPDLPGWQLTAGLKPAKETSGDFYDFIELPDRRLGIVVADVCDKGAAAALYMALCWTLIRTFATEYTGQPEIVLQAANHRLMKDTNCSNFITVFYAILDLETGLFVYCNSGHCPPYLLNTRESKNVRRLTRTGIPLGVLADETWKQAVVQINPGDMLVLYTDGITEAENAQGDFLGDDRLLEWVKMNLGRPASEIQEAILGDVQSFIGDAPQTDDIALVVLQRDADISISPPNHKKLV